MQKTSLLVVLGLAVACRADAVSTKSLIKRCLQQSNNVAIIRQCMSAFRAHADDVDESPDCFNDDVSGNWLQGLLDGLFKDLVRCPNKRKMAETMSTFSEASAKNNAGQFSDIRRAEPKQPMRNRLRSASSNHPASMGPRPLRLRPAFPNAEPAEAPRALAPADWDSAEFVAVPLAVPLPRGTFMYAGEESSELPRARVPDIFSVRAQHVAPSHLRPVRLHVEPVPGNLFQWATRRQRVMAENAVKELFTHPERVEVKRHPASRRILGLPLYSTDTVKSELPRRRHPVKRLKNPRLVVRPLLTPSTTTTASSRPPFTLWEMKLRQAQLRSRYLQARRIAVPTTTTTVPMFTFPPYEPLKSPRFVD